MSQKPETRFVDGMRVTADHLQHLQSSLQASVDGLETFVGPGRIGYGLRLLVAADGSSASLAAGLCFLPDGTPCRVAEDVELDVPDGDGPFPV